MQDPVYSGGQGGRQCGGKWATPGQARGGQRQAGVPARWPRERGLSLSDGASRKDSEPLQVRVVGNIPGRWQLMVGGVCQAVGAFP